MKKYAAFYYFLFLLLIMGAFASMAQNSYGLIICGIGCIGFVILFSYELVFPPLPVESSGSWLQRTELVLVIVIALLFAIRNFSIDGSFFINILNLLLLGILWSILYFALTQSRQPVLQEPSIAWPMACYYAAIVLLVISFLAFGALPLVGNILALAGISLVALFVVLRLAMKRKATVDGVVSTWQYVEELRNKSSIVLIAAVLLTGFNLLTSVGVLPPLYRDNVPPGYQVLVEEGVLNGDQKKAEEFESMYDQFIERWEK